MPDTTLAVSVNEKGEFKLENHPIPALRPKDVLIAIDSVGLCGTDLHIWKGHSLGNNMITHSKHVMGHESSGTVLKIGPEVTNLKPGDLVTIEPAIPCWNCSPCKSGNYNRCERVLYDYHPEQAGHLRKYFVHPADLCYKLPPNLSLKEGALIEPFTCALHACKRANVGMGKKVFISGAGGIGILSLIAAKALGASRVCIADVRASRLESAKKLGADAVLLVDSSDTKLMAEKVVSLLGDQPDISMDCSGTESGIQTGIWATKDGGVVESVGIPTRDIVIPMAHCTLKEIDLIGCVRFVHGDFKTALDLVESGKVNLKNVITHRFKLQDIAKAFEIAHTGADGSIKVTVAPADS